MSVDFRRRGAWLECRALSTCAVIGVVGGLAACSFLTAPLPTGAERFVPPAVYARWWEMVQSCSSRLGELGAVQWYRVPGSRFVLNRQWVAGYWNKSSNRIVLAEHAIEDGPTVRHEMLHALLKVDGHPRSHFLGSCAAVVRCQGVCIEDGGTWRAPRQDYVILPPDSLDIVSRAELLPREADGQRWLLLEILVRNARGRAVVVAAPGDPVTPPTFGYDLRGPSGGISGGEVAKDSSSLFFEPLERKRWLFEFLVASELHQHRITPGDYLVRGDYALRWSAFEAISVIP